MTIYFRANNQRTDGNESATKAGERRYHIHIYI